MELSTIKSWIKTRMTELLGFEDEVIINLAITQLEAAGINNPLNPKSTQINLTGFLEEKAMIFMTELWNLLLISQKSEGGIAPGFIQAKRVEILKHKEEVKRKRAMISKLQEAIKQEKPKDESKEESKNSEKKKDPENSHKKDNHKDRHKRYHRRDSSEEHHRRRSRDRPRQDEHRERYSRK